MTIERIINGTPVKIELTWEERWQLWNEMERENDRNDMDCFNPPKDGTPSEVIASVLKRYRQNIELYEVPYGDLLFDAINETGYGEYFDYFE